ncbi:MAG TPA: hypothetical protein VHC01_12425 [Gaiellaceae bacterium]|nr:hypothetical protein [Gaiellaceae bacterium]
MTFAILALLPAVAFATIAVQAGTEVGKQGIHDVGYWLRSAGSRSCSRSPRASSRSRRSSRR